MGGQCLSRSERLVKRDPWLGPGSGQTLVDCRQAGVGTSRARAARSTQGVSGATPTMGCGANLWVAGAEPAVVQGLRVPSRKRRSMGVFGNDPINAEETGIDGVRELLRHPLRLGQL